MKLLLSSAMISILLITASGGAMAKSLSKSEEMKQYLIKRDAAAKKKAEQKAERAGTKQARQTSIRNYKPKATSAPRQKTATSLGGVSNKDKVIVSRGKNVWGWEHGSKCRDGKNEVQYHKASKTWRCQVNTKIINVR